MTSLKHKEYPNFVTHLECSLTGEKYEAGIPHGVYLPHIFHQLMNIRDGLQNLDTLCV